MHSFVHGVARFFAPRHRQLFAIVAASTLAIAVVMGGALAWQSTKTFRNYRAHVGAFTWSASYQQSPGAIVGPDGAENLLGFVSVANAGDYNIRLRDGIIIIKNVDKGHAACNPANFSGRAVSLFPGGVLSPGDTMLNGLAVLMTVRQGAPRSCMGAAVTYDVRISLETAPNGPEPFN